MTLDEVERLLERGDRVGFLKLTDDPAFLGWILVSKLKPNLRMLEVLDEAEAPELLREERRRKDQPYLVLTIELNRRVHEDGGYETEGDYRMKHRLWFPDLRTVESQLVAWGYSLDRAKEASELDAP
jgi:hypothetical protein